MSRTQDQLRADFRKAFPDRDWNQSCQAAVAHAAQFTTGDVRFYLSAKDAYNASKIVSKNPAKAKRNDVHYWAIGKDWHTGVDLAGGGRKVLMATKHTDGSWGKNLGETTVADYSHATGAVYLGFSRTNGANRIDIAEPKPAAKGSAKVRRVGAFLNEQNLGKKTKAADTGVVDRSGDVAQAYWWLIQAWLIQQNEYPLSEGYKHDGKPARVGGLTRAGEDRINDLILAAKK